MYPIQYYKAKNNCPLDKMQTKAVPVHESETFHMIGTKVKKRISATVLFSYIIVICAKVKKRQQLHT
jgi:hypothetical protein